MNRRFCLVFITLTILSLVTSGHIFGMPVHAAATPVLSISPSSRPLAAPGSTVTYNVNVSNITPAGGLGGWEIYVQTNRSVLNPVDFTVSASLGAGFESSHCVNDVGTGCSVINDVDPVRGTVHSAFALFGSPVSGNLTLLTITYTAVAGPYSLLTFLRPSADTNLFDGLGAAISFTAANGSYGSVPVLPVASFTWTPLHPFHVDKVTFDASSSYDPNSHAIVSYSWLFVPVIPGPLIHDSHEKITTQVFDTGNWTATLTVTNDLGVSSVPTTVQFYVALKVIHDLAIIVYADSVSLLPGSIQTIDVVVRNVGTTTETRFNVSVSVPGQVFRPPPYPHLLPAGQATDFRLTWNTTGVEPGTYTIHAHLDPLANETNIANNDAFVSVTFVPYLISNDANRFFDSLFPTRPHQHELTANVFLESGSGFTGTVELSSPSFFTSFPSSILSIHLGSTSIRLTPNSFASTTVTIELGKNTVPGGYEVAVWAASGSFNFSTRLDVIVPSDDVGMRLSWSTKVSVNGIQTWEATVVNTLPTAIQVFFTVYCPTPTSPPNSPSCGLGVSMIVAANSTAKLTVGFRPFVGFQLGQKYEFIATLDFTDGINGFFLSSDVRTGSFTIVP